MDFGALSTAYTGAAAAAYDSRRASTLKWIGEANAVGDLLLALPPGSTVLDVPVGTGRFLKLYHDRGLRVVGRDISPDMLQFARERQQAVEEVKKIANKEENREEDCSLELGDVRSLPDADGAFDCALSSRFLNWVDARGLEEVLGELRRVSRRFLIVGIRHRVPALDLLFDEPKGLRRFMTGYSLRVKRFAKQLKHPAVPLSQTINHNRDDVVKIFMRLGLRVDARILVEHGRDGTDYVFYRLVKEAI